MLKGFVITVEDFRYQISNLRQLYNSLSLSLAVLCLHVCVCVRVCQRRRQNRASIENHSLNCISCHNFPRNENLL